MQDLAQLIESYDDQSEELQGLQRFRVQDILLVASLYDSYTLSEGKHLSELLFGTYLNLSFMTPPRINRVGTREQALAELEEQPYDLVITLAAAGAMSAPAFGRAVKALQPDAVVYVVAFNARELQGLAHGPGSPDGLDRFFIWRGDVRLFLSMIKLVEDRRNAETDSGLGGVRTLILVEDNISFYSSYLPILLDEFVRQTEALIGKSINAGQRLLRRRLRPKIMLATSLEEGWELYEKYQATVLAVICDVQFPWRGDPQREAGIELLSRIRERDPDLPLMLQSSRAYYAEEAGRLGASFLDKRSPTLLGDFRTFMFENLGFGDFVFRDAKGEEITRADDIDSMLMVLDDVPVATLRYHASRNHFSNWLMARTEFHLADELRHMRISDFPNIEAMREFLRQRLTAIRSEERHGQVEDFVATRFDTSTEFARIGEGSLGGKGRGLAFLHDLISRTGIEQAIEGLRIYVPHSAVLGTAVFDAFVAQDDLLAFALRENDDQAILDRFQAASLPESIIADLRDFLEQVRYPLAVRSSSLLEDSHHLPAAGVYPTHMLPNADPDPEIRQTQLCLAIKHIFASTFFQNAKAYLAATPNRVEDEKMAVIIQQVVGRRHDSWVYPGLSGAACSYNYYPIRDMKPEEGIATVALGLGRTVAEGGRAVRFSPAHPQWLPQMSTPEDILKNAQTRFWALDVTRAPDLRRPEADNDLVALDLAAAERHGTLWPVASVYSQANDAVYEGLSRQGPRLVTMAPILKHKLLPLPEAIRHLLAVGELGMGGPVEIEFAVDTLAEAGRPRDFAVLQIRPLAAPEVSARVDMDAMDEADIFVRAQALGAGRNTEIRDIVAVKLDAFDRAHSRAVAAEVGQINHQLMEAGRPYLLIGPGRWGTSDPWLGIPVAWHQIAGARAIVECKLAGIAVEPSQGTHFFQNMTSLGIGYFTPNPRLDTDIDWGWLETLSPDWEGQWVRHFRLEAPLEVIIDGRQSEGVILKRVRA
ncbi:MAG: histidine kinase [Chloroflexi bacterium]|nr:histidine kinase [Chloroflexota bacterium]